MDGQTLKGHLKLDFRGMTCVYKIAQVIQNTSQYSYGHIQAIWWDNT